MLQAKQITRYALRRAVVQQSEPSQLAELGAQLFAKMRDKRNFDFFYRRIR